MSVFASLKENNATPVTLFNTGTLYDLMTGAFSMGEDGKFRLNGGIGNFITGIHGGGNMYKSTAIDSLIMGCMRTYPEAECFIADTEGSKSAERVANFRSELLALNQGADPLDVIDRITLIPLIETDVGSTYTKLVEICALKEKNKKTLQVEMPFLHPKTHKPYKAWIPTFFFIDSLTEMETTAEAAMLERGIDHKANQTIWMVDGNKKTLLVRTMRKMAAEYGICIICSAHTGGNINMDSFGPPAKQLQHMKQADRIKGVGSRFEFLTHVLCQAVSCNQRPVQDSAKKPTFPKGITSDVDLNEVVLKVQRNKTNASGLMVPFVVSQQHGLLNCVTNLHYIRTNGYHGLVGGPSNPKHACVWYPEKTFSRNTFRTDIETDYKLCRSIELMARYLYIKNNWNLSTIPFDFSLTPEEVFAKVKASGKMSWDDILETTGSWNYDPKNAREYLSVLDIMAMISPE
jgi:hypothetical protein